MSTQTQARPVSSSRGIGLPIAAWLVLTFVFVIGVFAVTSVLSVQGTRHATADLARLQQQFEPVAGAVRELGDGLAGFDRAVLAFLHAPSDANRDAAAAAGAELSQAANRATEVTQSGQSPAMEPLLRRIGERQASGFALLGLQDQRGQALTELEQVYGDLHRRILGAGGSGVVVGDSVLARPSLNELTRALEEARSEVSGLLAQPSPAPDAQPPAAMTSGETTLRRTLDAHRDEFARSPGQVWLDLTNEDVARTIALRRRIQQLDTDVEAGRAAFADSGPPLADDLHARVEAPAWRAFIAATADARQAMESAGRGIEQATVKSVLFALLALTLTAWAITWPIRRLTAGTRRLAAGDLTARVPRGGAAEVDELARAFNHMATELDAAERVVRTYQAQLEQRVEERTLQLRHLADHDPLTSLPNRRQLFRHLNDLLGHALPGRTHVAVLFLDLDNFKTVNDSLGHEFGDRVLTGIGARLRDVSGDGGFIARLGGDEFTLVFTYSGDPAEVERRANRLVDGFQRPLAIDRREISVGVSCGVATYPEHGRDATALLRAADAALFRAKELGRNRLCVHDPSMLVDASNRFRVEQALRKAIDGGDFVLHYQPQVCLGEQRTVTVEALLRWRTSDTHIVPAGEFLEIAEQSGLMLDLNDWVIESAARAVRDWRANGWPEARVAINVSAQQFVAGNFLASMERVLARYDLAPDALELELTENMLQTGAITVETLHGLRALGVATALDDFGIGYSSLTSLEQLPLTRVKLDRSVIAEVDRNPRAAAIARSIIGLCRSLGLAVTAEGVERAEQLAFLEECGDITVQGFLIGRPTDAAVVLDYVRDSGIRIATLLRAAELSRAAREGDDTSRIRLLRRRRP